jgi:hypothetical protein
MAGSKLPNIGYDYKFTPDEIRRFGFTLYKNDANVVNSLVLATVLGAPKTTLQAKFNKYNFEADTSDKIVFTPLCYAAGAVAGEPTAFDQNGYYRVLKQGTYDFNYTFYDIAPKLAAQMQDISNYQIAAWLVTSDNKLLCLLDGANIKPLRIQNMNTPDYTPPTSETVSTLTCKFRLETGADTANMVTVDLSDMEVTDDDDFFSLRDVTGTVSAPAVTGCDVILAVDYKDPTAPNTAIYLTGSSVVYTTVTFTDNATSADITLAAAGSISYSASTHKHTISEAGLLTTQHTYTLKIRVSGFDITCGVVTVP